MDSVAQLALMTKAKRVFESPGTFLSFPALSPLTYAPDQLTFATDGAMTTQDLTEMAEFARVTNVMPSGVVAPVVSDELLWEVCADVLRTAEIAAGTMSAANQARYDAAVAYLYGPSGSGDPHREDSPALRAYRRCRDAWIKAQEDFKTQQLTSESSEDPAAREAWAAEEPRLRRVITALEAEWATTGCRDQVEAAQQVELSLGGQSPVRLWSEWKNALVDMIDLTTDTGGNEFAVTGFTPADVFDGGTWPSFTVTGAEIAALVAQAPPELEEIFGTSSTASDIESISFEYRSVGLVRPWLRPAMLTSRFWRLGAGGGELSDGAAAPTGRCTSFVSGLVFARNIVVKRAAQPPARMGGAMLRDFMAFQPELMARLPAATLARASVGAASLAPIASVVIRDHRGSEATSSSRTPGGVVVRDHRTAGPVVRDHRTPFGGIGTVLQGQVFTEATPPVSEPPPPVEPEPPSTDVTILALICRRTPRCPDPDPSLDWPLGTVEETPPAERLHVVVAGDTLAKIAAEYYGDAKRWLVIAERNKITDPRALQIGQRLSIP
ncbi:MAG: LysM peptidoglycan-binding domain-containing protein [Nocardioidaceae bacterium]